VIFLEVQKRDELLVDIAAQARRYPDAIKVETPDVGPDGTGATDHLIMIPWSCNSAARCPCLLPPLRIFFPAAPASLRRSCGRQPTNRQADLSQILIALTLTRVASVLWLAPRC
jgi:hypothetical protein